MSADKCPCMFSPKMEAIVYLNVQLNGHVVSRTGLDDRTSNIQGEVKSQHIF